MAATIAQHAHPAAGAQPADPPSPPASLVGSLTLLLRFSGVMAVILATASLPGSALFAVREITVQGAQNVSPTTIVSRSGLHRGDPLFTVSPPQVARTVETLPRVARASVHLALDGRVTIAVTERTAHVAVPFRGEYLILDSSGRVMDGRPSAGRLPVVTTEPFSPSWVRMGDRLPDPRVQLAIDALDVLPETIVGPGTNMRVDDAGELIFVSSDGITVRLGPFRGLPERAAVLAEILKAIRDRRLAVDYLDLRFSGNVVMRPRSANRGGERRP